MDISDSDFMRLVKKAVNIDETTVDIVANGLNIDKSVLEKWAKGEEMPIMEERETILKDMVEIMMNTLVNILDEAEEKSE